MTFRVAWIALFMTLAVAAIAQQSNVVKEIIVRGNNRVTTTAILGAMRTKVGEPFAQETLNLDEQTIEAMGWFSAVDARATPVDSGWQVTVDVQEFPEIKEVRITGNSVVNTQDILNAMTMKPGEVYNLNSLRPSAEAIQRLYASKGYVALIEEFQMVQDQPGVVSIRLIEVEVGTVGFQGNTRTKDWVMRRLIKTRPGEVFSIQKWTNDLRRLINTQWFESVQSIEDTQRELGKIDLTADVKESRTGLFNIGVQIDPRSSIAGVLRLQENNLYGTGKSVGINFLQSARGDGPSVDLDYYNPFYDSSDTSMRVSVYSRLIYRFSNTLFGGGGIGEDDQRFTERRTGASLGFARPVTDNLTVGISGRFENIRTGDLELIDNGNSTFGKGRSHESGHEESFIKQDGDVGVLTFGGTLNRRDVDVDPSRGDWIRFELEPGYANITSAGGALAGEAELGSSFFTRGMVEYRKYWSPQPPRGLNLEAPRRVFAARVRYGAIAGKVPFFEQFFAGGSTTVRGYPEDRFWGKQTLITSLEYRHPVQRSFNLVAFVDYGGAWGGYGGVLDFSQSNTLKLHLGYGLGISFRTPLGPIRLDVGFDENGKSRTHFMIGTSF